VKRRKKPSKEKIAAKAISRIAEPRQSQHGPAMLKTSPAAVDLVVKHCYGRSEECETLSERKRLFLRVGDEVSHNHYEQWGIGVVVEVMTSTVPGGTCLARIRFQDGQLRCFNNDLDNESCCYYFGVRRYWNPSQGTHMVRSKFLSLKG
jgi:hypothetical protein